MDNGQLALGWIALLVVGWLGFMGNPVIAWKISVALLTLQYAYFLVKGFLEFFIIVAALFSVVALAELAMARIGKRDARWTLVRWSLTGCALFSLAQMAPMFFQMLLSSGVSVDIAIFTAIIAGPSCFIAAALWKGEPRAENQIEMENE